MKLASYVLKSGIIAAFFWAYTQISAAQDTDAAVVNDKSLVARYVKEAARLKLHTYTVWLALLNSRDGTSYIEDTEFLLSYPAFSPEKELALTINFLYQGPAENVCRYPARYYWLRHILNTPELPLNDCREVAEFRNKVPMDSISLIFASERISQPASMLGHTFLKVSGQDQQQREISHGISFYTDADTLNFPKLLFESLVTGKQGYFSLTSYQEKIQRYVDEEQRNLWEFRLTLDEFQIELIRLSILELKNAHLSYYFQKYNCATVINYLLELSGKPMNDNDLWITPKDLVKNAYKANLISGAKLVTPSRWIYRKLSEQINQSDSEKLIDNIKKGRLLDEQFSDKSDSSFIMLELARAYNQYAYVESNLDEQLWSSNKIKLNKISTQYFQDRELVSGDNYNPLESAGDSQISLTHLVDARGAGQLITFLPVSHTLYDDNRGYSTETGLQLLTTSLRYQNDKVSLDKLTVFDMISLTPYLNGAGGYSSRFSIGIDQQADEQLQNRRVFTTNGALGLTRRTFQDMDLYAMIGPGFSHTGDSGLIYATAEIGGVIREIWNMKTTMRMVRTENLNQSMPLSYTFNLVHSIYFSKEYSLLVDFKQNQNSTIKQNEYTFTIKKIF